MQIEKIFEIMDWEKQHKGPTYYVHVSGQSRTLLEANEKDFALEWGWITQKRFLEKFYDKYYPTSSANRKKLSLWHSLMIKTVAQYEATFAELARFGEPLVFDAKREASMFERGLRLTIWHKLSVLHCKIYEEVYERALFVERDLKETQKYRERKEKKRERKE